MKIFFCIFIYSLIKTIPFSFHSSGSDRRKIETMLTMLTVTVTFNKYNYANLMPKRVLINLNVFFLRNNINSPDHQCQCISIHCLDSIRQLTWLLNQSAVFHFQQHVLCSEPLILNTMA